MIWQWDGVFVEPSLQKKKTNSYRKHVHKQQAERVRLDGSVDHYVLVAENVEWMKGITCFFLFFPVFKTLCDTHFSQPYVISSYDKILF